MEVKEYITNDGSNPFRQWVQSLDKSANTKVEIALTRMALGNTSNIKWFGGIGEYKINWGPGYRIYLVKEGEQLIILLGGGTKKSQQKDIKKAQRLGKELKQRRRRE